MSKKEVFIEEVENLLFETHKTLSEDAAIYFEALKGMKENSKPKFTVNGKLILQYMRDNKETYNNVFTAKSVGEGLNITSRTASGATRKLVTDGFVEKMADTSPTAYMLTKLGEEVDINEE